MPIDIFGLLYRKPAPAASTDNPLKDALKARVREGLSLGEEDIVKVAEISCGVPDCPDVETVVLVLRKGRRTQALKIASPLVLVTESDIDEALALAASGADRL